MKRIFLSMLMAATITGAMAQEKLNPWGLVYDGALTENVVGEVQLHPVSYEVGGLRVHLWDHLRIGGEGHIFIPFLGTSDK